MRSVNVAKKLSAVFVDADVRRALAKYERNEAWFIPTQAKSMRGLCRAYNKYNGIDGTREELSVEDFAEWMRNPARGGNIVLLDGGLFEEML